MEAFFQLAARSSFDLEKPSSRAGKALVLASQPAHSPCCNQNRVRAARPRSRPREADSVMRQEFPAVRDLGRDGWGLRVGPRSLAAVGGPTRPAGAPGLGLGWRPLPSQATGCSGSSPAPCSPERSPWGALPATGAGADPWLWPLGGSAGSCHVGVPPSKPCLQGLTRM